MRRGSESDDQGPLNKTEQKPQGVFALGFMTRR
jgi:hypothetical protein